MKVLVIGATGRLGYQLVHTALDKGHEVTAFARNIEEFGQVHPRLHLLKGDVLYPSLVEAAVVAHDAVISVIGVRKFSGPITLLSRGMHHVVSAMETHGVKRLLAVTGAGILQEDDHRLIMDSLSFPPNLQNISLDHRAVYDLLVQSQLDWTIVCPAFMTRGSRTRAFLLRRDYYPSGARNEVSLQDVADFMTDEMVQNEYIKSRVGIAQPYQYEEDYIF
jgi:putative NADH-flavin reductase